MNNNGEVQNLGAMLKRRVIKPTRSAPFGRVSALVAAGLAAALAGCVSENNEVLVAQAPAPVDAKQRQCILRAMYFESSRSSYDGMMAVGTVVMNRKDSGMFAPTICGVVGQPHQFADGALRRQVSARESAVAERAADDIMAGKRHANMERVMYFHTAGLHFSYPNMHYRLVAGGNAFYERYLRHALQPVTAIASADSTASGAAVSTVAVLPTSQTSLAYAAPAPVSQASEGQRTAVSSFLADLGSDRQGQAAPTVSPTVPSSAAEATSIQPGASPTDTTTRSQDTTPAIQGSTAAAGEYVR